SAARVFREKVSEADPSLLVYNVATLVEREEQRSLPYRIVGYVIGAPGALALVLGIIGTYGTIAILVAQRKREGGIRIALVAHPPGAVRNIFLDGILPISVGTCLGVVLAEIVVLWLSRNVTGVPAFDPVAFIIPTLLVVSTAGIACYIPVKRASRLDPMI